MIAEQIDRIDGGGGIDVAHDAAREVVHRGGNPRRTGLLVERSRAPPAVVAIENVRERDRLAEIDVHTTEALPQLSQSAYQAEHALLLLGLAGQLADVGGAFDDALVAEIHRQEHHRARGVAQEAAHGHRQHAGLRLQQAAGAAAAAFDEVLDGMAPRHDGREVLHEDDGVEAVAAEFAANEEGAAHAQQPADDGQIQIDAGRDVRHGIAVDVDDVGQQQIVHVAAVARHVDDLVALRGALESLQMPDRDAVIEAIPQPGQQTLEESNEGMRVVGGDLFRVTRGLQQCHAPRE